MTSSSPTSSADCPAGTPTVILNGPAAGGSYKTHNVVAISALLRLCGHETLLVDADPSTRGLSERLPGRTFRYAAGSADLEAEFTQVLEASGHGSILIDSGAAAIYQPLLLQALTLAVDEALRRGYRCVLSLNLVAGKAGLERDIASYRRIFSPSCDLVALCGGGGAAEFARYDEALAGLPRIYIPHLSPAFVEFATIGGLPLDEVLLAPPADYSLAAARLASWLKEIAVQPETARLLGTAPPIDRLAQLAANAPTAPYRYVGLARITDEQLRADDEVIKALSVLQRLDVAAASDALLQAARSYLERRREQSAAIDRAAR